ncbi:EamA family transporter [Candidatus Parcubacteria bacterium]|nr:EamA family transporter [Candidatus Parcubacteria bacterium]
MWLAYAFLSAAFAALVAILAKLGLKHLDSTLATTVRAVIMAAFLLLVALSLGKFQNFSLAALTGKEWILISLSGVAGALSWLAYFYALKEGNATSVVAIDKLSIVMVIVLAAIFLGEAAGWKAYLGGALMAAGAILITL